MNLAAIVTGDRHATPDPWEEIVRRELEWLRTYRGDGDQMVILHGAARGIDSIARRVIREIGAQEIAFPADWQTYRKAAGPMRNQQMLTRLLRFQREGFRVGVMAFHDDLAHSKGTGDMVRQAEASGVPVLTYTTQRTKEGKA